MYPYRLLAPGPVPISKEVKKILSEDMIHHRSPLFQSCIENIQEKLPQIFDCDDAVLSITSTGSGAMEAAVLNFVQESDKVLVITSGKFGSRWLDMAQSISKNCIELKVNSGESLELSDLEEVLKKNPDIKAVFSQACETSTGALHPFEGLAQMCKKLCPEALVIIDAITAILTVPLSMKEMGIDVVVAGSQKAFMLPTGLAFIALSKKARKRILKQGNPNYYLNLNRELAAYEKKQTAFSSNVPVMRGLSFVLNEILANGIDTFIAQVQKRAEITRIGLKALGLSIYAKHPAPALTAVNVPEGIDGKKLRKHIEEKYNVTFMGGQDQLEGKILRIGHMGAITKEDVLASIEILSLALKDFSYHCDTEKALKEMNDAYEK